MQNEFSFDQNLLNLMTPKRKRVGWRTAHRRAKKHGLQPQILVDMTIVNSDNGIQEHLIRKQLDMLDKGIKPKPKTQQRTLI